MTDTREPEGTMIAAPLEPIEPLSGIPELGRVQQIGQWALVWQRFKRHRLAVIGAWVALFVVLLAIVGPFVAPPLPKLDAYGQLPLAAQRLENMPPQLNWPYIMGTDFGAGPVVTNVLTGGGPILSIGIFGALMASILGVMIGGVAGYLGSYVDAFLMRLVDAFLAIPFLILLILLAKYLPFERTIPVYILIFGLAGWAGVARLVRSYILSLREREYTVAARALGVSPGGIILRHLLPNALDVLVVSFTLNVAVFMVTDVTLDFLNSGTGISSWGSGLAALGGPDWWIGAFPGVALLLTVLAVNFLGDGLRDALDTGSTTALVTLRPPTEAGRLRRMMDTIGGMVGSAREGVRARVGALEVGRRREAALGRAVPAGVRAWSAGDNTRAYASTPIALAIGPIALALLVAGAIMLLGHSPLNYAPDYAAPTTVAQAYTEQGYGAWPVAKGWDIFQVDTRADLVFQHVDATGRLVREQRVARGDSAAIPSMAENHGRVLGAWAADSGQVIRAAYLGGSTAHPVTLNSPGGIAEHPYVLSAPGGRFDVLFDWQPAGSSADNVYLTVIGAGDSPVRLQQLTNVRTAIYPHGVIDGSGALDLAYLQETAPDYGLWHVYFQRFTGARPFGRRQDLGVINYVGPNGCKAPANAPYQWALDMKRARDHSVWAAWEYGSDCAGSGGVTGANTLAVAHWSRTGATLLPPTVVSRGVDAAALSVALALRHGGGILYYPTPAGVEPILSATTFGSQGQVTQTTRVAYDAGGRPANPEARTIAGTPAVIWQKVRGGAVTLEGTRYRAAAPPDLLTRLGLNIGALWGNLLLVIFGSLAGGIALTVVNLYLLAPLLVVWLLLRRIRSPRIRWPIFLAAIAALLAWLFAAHPTPPWFVLMFAAFGFPYAWVAVAGGVFASWWSGAFVLSRQESGMRAMVMALMGLYFVAVMYAVIFIEGQLGQI